MMRLKKVTKKEKKKNFCEVMDGYCEELAKKDRIIENLNRKNDE